MAAEVVAVKRYLRHAQGLFGEHFDDEGGLAGPPPVDSGLADAGACGDGFYGDLGIGLGVQKQGGGLQNGVMAESAAWTARGAAGRGS